MTEAAIAACVWIAVVVGLVIAYARFMNRTTPKD